MSDRHPDQQHVQHYRHETEMLRAVVTGRSGTSVKRIPRVDITMIESRRQYKDVPVLCQPGVVRIPRLSQVVHVFFLNGAIQRPYVICHAHNLDDPNSSPFANPLASAFQYLDDLVLYHDETGAFIRFRNQRSSPTTGGGDGRAGLFEVTMASGASLSFAEVPQLEPPPPPPPVGGGIVRASKPAPPNQATLTFRMPSGAKIVVAEPQVGQATLDIKLPSGAELSIDASGVITAHSPQKAIVDAPDVELAGDSGAAQGNRLVRYKDLDAFVQTFNQHTHQGAVPAPTPPFTTPTCSTKAFAED